MRYAEKNKFVIYLKKTNRAKMVSRQISLTKAEGVLRNLAKFTGKHLCQSLFFKGTPMQI